MPAVTCSPHITSVTERIQVNSSNISNADFQQLVPQIAKELQQSLLGGKSKVTHFELLTALAFQHFNNQQVSS